jgi:hypothetical protein
MADLSIALQQSKTHHIAIIKRAPEDILVLTSLCNYELLIALSAALPYLFSGYAQQISTEYKTACELIATLDHKYDADIVKALNKIITTFDVNKFKQTEIFNALKRHINGDATLRTFEQRINDYEDSINSYYLNITSAIKAQNDLRLKILGLQSMNADEELNTTVDFLLKNKFIKNIKYINSGYLYFEVDTPIYFIDDVYLKMLLSQDRAYIKTNGYGDAWKIFDAVFIKKKYELMTKTRTMLNLQKLNEMLLGMNTHAVQNIFMVGAVGDACFSNANAIPQPHMTYFQCFGNNKTPMLKALQNRDITALIAQFVAACQNLNFADNPVINRTMQLMYDGYTRNKFLRDTKTGEFIDYKEFLKREVEQTPENTPEVRE